jgi:penicillin-binding protein 2
VLDRRPGLTRGVGDGDRRDADDPRRQARHRLDQPARRAGRRRRRLNLAIGQGENAQTLLSMVRLYQMLATDGVARTPYVVHPRQHASTSLGLDEAQLTILRRAMQNVVERGTARASRLEDLSIAGKTATSQNPHGPDHGWFIGFGPAERPEIVVGAVIEFARHGSSVGPLVARVIARYLGMDPTSASAIRLVLPADSAPAPLQLLPGPAGDTLTDTVPAVPPPRMIPIVPLPRD